MDNLIYLVPLMGAIGLLYTFIKFSWVSKQDAGNDRMKEISTYIAEGAMAFLKAEWKILTYFVVIAAVLLAFMGTRNANSHPASQWLLLLALFLAPWQGTSECESLQRQMCVLPRQRGPALAKPFCVIHRRFRDGPGCCWPGRAWTWRFIHYTENDFRPTRGSRLS